MRSHSRFTDHDRSGGEELDEGVIEVQVIPQDDNWGETATTITETTATSVISGISETNLSDIGKDFRPCRFNFRRHCGFAFTALLGSLGVLSPVVFVIIPILLGESQGFLNDCSSVGSEPTTANVTRYLNECDGLYMSLGFREVILIAGIWALYFRTPRINFPRVNRLKISVMGLAFIIVMSYWVIFGYRMFEDGSKSSKSIVQFALSLADTLLFVHYLSLVALWFRQSRVTFTMKVIRSTDGVSRFYNVGLMSIQQAAAFVLNHYYKDFPEYNPLLMSIPSARKSQNKETTSIKFYDIDGKMGNDSANANSRARAVIAATARKRESRHNDRFYEEEEYARRVKKRRARLVTATEEAFTHVKKLKLERGPCVPLDAEEAAQAIFPSLARPLQKYLRTTRQQYRYSMESILKHLAHCLIFDMTPKAFLERYVNEQPCVQLLAENIKSWRLVCEEQLTSSITKSTVFQLLRDEYSLVVTVNQLPQYDIMEEDFDFDDNQFVLRLNSETSV